MSQKEYLSGLKACDTFSFKVWWSQLLKPPLLMLFHGWPKFLQPNLTIISLTFPIHTCQDLHLTQDLLKGNTFFLYFSCLFQNLVFVTFSNLKKKIYIYIYIYKFKTKNLATLCDTRQVMPTTIAKWC